MKQDATYVAKRSVRHRDATWLPLNKSFRCTCVARQVAVKGKYGLWVTAAERDAMTRALAACLPEPDTEPLWALEGPVVQLACHPNAHKELHRHHDSPRLGLL
jgi:hypothetical protein